MNILILEPFYTDSHKQWLDGLVKYSTHSITKLTLPGFHWKWRMHGAAVTLAKAFLKLGRDFDLILSTDMLDLSTFLGLLRRELVSTPVGIYFHENQLTYPWSPNDADPSKNRDRHYAFINFTSALSADFILFNSQFHLDSFIDELPTFLRAFPDFNNLSSVKSISSKSGVLPLGLELKRFEKFRQLQTTKIPNLLWNHRWEYDKNPELFFKTLFKLKKKGFQFTLTVLGKKYPDSPEIFEIAKQNLSEEIRHWGYVESFEEYAELLSEADFLPVTSNQDFFGISVVEAIYSGATPILPLRLAYQEHIRESSFFYTNDEEFAEMLEMFIKKHPHRSRLSLEKIASYDWANQIIQYDALFSKLSANFARKLIT